MYCEPLKAVFKPLDIAINDPFLVSRNPGRVILGTPCRNDLNFHGCSLNTSCDASLQRSHLGGFPTFPQM